MLGKPMAEKNCSPYAHPNELSKDQGPGPSLSLGGLPVFGFSNSRKSVPRPQTLRKMAMTLHQNT
eukprot:2742101-Rhodomonas_salina.1